MSERKCCGTCRYNKPVNRESEYMGKWAYRREYECQNEESDGFGFEIIYDESCEEWEGKDGRY
ncbi:MAG: hypothetical protein LUD12_02785 [Lachnospiraceae bacterium]|nr:hypothetical protein [Lachnospiraceae bacterium]